MKRNPLYREIPDKGKPIPRSASRGVVPAFGAGRRLIPIRFDKCIITFLKILINVDVYLIILIRSLDTYQEPEIFEYSLIKTHNLINIIRNLLRFIKHIIICINFINLIFLLVSINLIKRFKQL